MSATAFDSDASLNELRMILRRDVGDVEMVKLPWGLQPREPGDRAFIVVRSEGRTFPTHRCLVPVSEFRHRSHGKHYSFSLANGDWFYFAGIWRPATRDWPEPMRSSRPLPTTTSSRTTIARWPYCAEINGWRGST